LNPAIYIALGAIIAALITGAISFVNIIIAKDQKISEFRQNWIDRLREDIAEFTSHVEFISSRYEFMMKTNPKVLSDPLESDKFVISLAENFHVVAKMYHRIQIRLNPEEHKQFLKDFHTIYRVFEKHKIHDFKLVTGLINTVISHSQTVLRKEWKRVKRGELGYNIAKYAALVSFIAILFLAFLYAQDWISISFKIP
jgi:Asp-tRNA(Asn)/Glu-tRNA(Gln) amidotransferase C subunit